MTAVVIRMHERDNVAIVANDGGLAAGTQLLDGVTLRERVPQGHKVALVDLPAGAPVMRYINPNFGGELMVVSLGCEKMQPERLLPPDVIPIADGSSVSDVGVTAEPKLEQCPVIKVATRSDLARRWHDLMDLDAGRIATGSATIEDMGWELFRLMLDVASGRKTCAEHYKLANSLALFNPAPVT